MISRITYNKAKSILQIDVFDSTKASKKPLNIFLPSLIRKAANVNTIHSGHLSTSKKQDYTLIIFSIVMEL